MCKPTGYEENRREWNKNKYRRTGEINSSKICRVACLAMFRVCRVSEMVYRGKNDFRETGCKAEMRSKWLRMDPNISNGNRTTGLTNTWNTVFLSREMRETYMRK